MRKLIVALLVSVCCTSFALAGDSDKTADAKKPLDFKLKDTSGKVHELSKLKDKLVVLEWIEPVCPTCQRHAKDGTMNALVKKYAKNKDVVFYGILSSRASDVDSMKAFAKKHGLKYDILVDSTGEVGHLFKARKTPHMFVVKNGAIQYQGAIDNDPRGGMSDKERVNYVSKAVDELLKDKPVSTKSTKPYG